MDRILQEDFEKVSENGGIYQIADPNIKVMNVSVIQDGKQVLSPTAIDSWNDTKEALRILGTGRSSEGYIFEVIVSNVTISMLVTGFEAYTKKRVIELEQEGIKPDLDAFFGASELGKEQLEQYQKEADKEDVTFLQYLVKKRYVNFQDYEKCKEVFNKIFGIKFGAIGCTSQVLEKLQKFIIFRHRIIHVSALEAILNQLKVPPEDPIFSNKILSEEAIRIFDLFINKLHKATLQKRN